MMTCVRLLLCVSLLLHSALVSRPPAPVNLRVDSLNFHHVLRWDPGPRAPPGTQYRISVSDGEDWNMTALTAGTSMRVVLPEPDSKYKLNVTAFYNQTWSPPSRSCEFSPYADTEIGPLEFSLAGYGNSIRINISVPPADNMSGVPDIQQFYDADFKVWYRMGSDGEIMQLAPASKYVTLDRLKRGVEYCVQVELVIGMNKHSRPSAWKCTFTTPVELQTGLVPGVVTGIPIAVIFILTSSLFFLFYTGVICKLREAVPRVLRTALTKGYILTPEPVIPDPIFVTSETGGPNHPPMSPAAHSDAESEDDDDDRHYVNRGAGLSSGESSRAGSGSMSMKSDAPSDSASSELFAEVKVKVLPAEGEEQVEAEGEEGCRVKETHQRVWEQSADEGGVEEDEEVRDTSSSVNLFSVTLASMAARDEEEEEAMSDCLPATDSQTESGDQLTPEGPPTHVSEGRCRDTGEEEEEEESSSPYLRNK